MAGGQNVMPEAKKMEIEALRSAFRDQGNQNIGLPASSKWATEASITQMFLQIFSCGAMSMGKSPVQKQSMCARCYRVYFMTSATTSTPAPPAIYQLPARAASTAAQAVVSSRCTHSSSLAVVQPVPPALLR
jgi:hypothetical protein